MIILPATPQEDAESILYEGALTPARRTATGPLLGPNDSPEAPPEGEKGLVVSIGRPLCWPLVALYEQEQKALPAEIVLLKDQATFSLVRLACSFKPDPDIRVDWARFSVTLLGDGEDDHPIAVDIHPLLISEKREKQVKVGITPKFKFSNVEAELVSSEFGVQYEVLDPIIIGAGVAENSPNWTFRRTKQQEVVGSKLMHMIVQHAAGGRPVRASFEVMARITKAGHFWPFWTRDEDMSRLAAVMCGA